MYRFKIEKREEFLEGRKIGYIAEKVGIAREYMSSILCGSRHCSKLVAFCMIKSIHPNAEISDYFEIIKK